MAIFYDPSREVPGEDRYQSLAAGLLHSLCVVPLLSYGATAPLASLAGSVSPTEAAVAAGGKGAVQPEAQELGGEAVWSAAGGGGGVGRGGRRAAGCARLACRRC